MPRIDTLVLRRACPLALTDLLRLAPVVRADLPPALAALGEAGAVRACGLCAELVVDVSALDADAAEAFLARSDRPSCLLVLRDRLGRAVHRPAAHAGAAAGLAALVLGGCCPTLGRASGPNPGVHGGRAAADWVAAHPRRLTEEQELLLVLGGYIDDGDAPAPSAPSPAPAPSAAGTGGGFRAF